MFRNMDAQPWSSSSLWINLARALKYFLHGKIHVQPFLTLERSHCHPKLIGDLHRSASSNHCTSIFVEHDVQYVHRFTIGIDGGYMEHSAADSSLCAGS